MTELTFIFSLSWIIIPIPGTRSKRETFDILHSFKNSENIQTFDKLQVLVNVWVHIGLMGIAILPTEWWNQGNTVNAESLDWFSDKFEKESWLCMLRN